MKQIVYITLILSFLTLLLGCEKEYEAPVEFSDIEVYIPEWANKKEIGPKINVNNYFAFMDLSHGELSHKWSFAKDSGCYFLKPNLPSPSNIDSYLKYIDENATNVSNEANVSVLFTKGGLHGIRLYNTFKDSVGFSMIYGATKSAVFDEEQQVWVIDTTFYVDVYDSIAPEFKVLDTEGIEIALVHSDNSNDWVSTEVEVGQSLTYIDLTTVGRPNQRTWTFTGGSPTSGSDSVQSVVYTKVTDKDSYYKASIYGQRVGEDVPSAGKTAQIPLKINVVPPTVNVEYISSSINESGELLLSFNQGIILPDNSFISVTNDGVDNPIVSVSYESPDNIASLIVELTDIPEYGTEVAFTIEANTLISEYETPSAPKRNDNLISESTISAYGIVFELDFNSGNIPTVPVGTVPDIGKWAFANGATVTADADAYEGEFAGLFAEPANATTGSLHAFTPFFSLEEGKNYRLEAYIKAKAPPEVGKVFKFYMRKAAGNNGSLNQAAPALTNDYVKVVMEFTADVSGNDFNLRFSNNDWNNSTLSRPIQCLVDNLVIYEF